MDISEFSEEEFSKTLDRNIKALSRGKKSCENTVAILLGGQSGAGKTTIHRIKIKEFTNNIIIIDGDSFRYQHPNYIKLQEKYGKDSVEYTKKFSGMMVERLIEEFSNKKYNLIIEGTLRTIEVPQKTAEKLKKKSYNIELSIIATKPKLSYLSTKLRYYELKKVNKLKARATPKKYHDAIVTNLVDNIKYLENINIFNRIQVYHRDRSYKYDSLTSKGKAYQVVYDILFGKWTNSEEDMLLFCEEKLFEYTEDCR